jgi:hypothetical protein
MTGTVEIISRTYRKVKGKYYARVRYKFDDGKPLDILRQVENKSAIKPKQAEIEVEDQEAKITGFRSVVPAHSALNNLVAFFGDIDIRKINEKKLTDYQVARLTGTIKNLRKVSLSTVDRELSKARRLFNIALDEGWLLRSPFTKAVSRNLIHDAAETPDPIKTRELTDEEALRVMKALDTPERRHTLPVFIAAMDTGARKSGLLDYLRWKDINFADEIIKLTAYKGKSAGRCK